MELFPSADLISNWAFALIGIKKTEIRITIAIPTPPVVFINFSIVPLLEYVLFI
jgi:hypothetical protein